MVTPRRRSLLVAGAGAALGACLPDGSLKRAGSVVPEPLDDGWETATPESAGVDPAALAAIERELLREDRQFGALAFLVVKDGKLVWESYLRDPADRDRHHHIQSMTKSVTSMAFGMARDAGLFPALDARLDAYFPQELAGLGPEKAGITLEQLLTMRSGLAFYNDRFAVEMWVDKPANPLRYILSKPLYAPPGTKYDYRDADPQLLGYALDRVTGEHEEAWVRRKLFEPLGIRDYLWERGPDGVSMAAHGLHLRPRDAAKLGQLWLDRGAWRGQALVSAAWLDEATQGRVAPDPSNWVPPGTLYGYYFWILPRQRAFTAAGHGGQYITVVPDERLVLVKVSLPDSDDLEGGPLSDWVRLIAPLLPGP